MQSDSRSLKCSIPWMMAAGRAVLGPLMVLGVRAKSSGIMLAGMVLAALMSDIFDGVLARRWQCDTPAVRLFDSMSDNVFYVGCAAALWMRQPQLMHRFAVPVTMILALEILKLIFDFAKFGKPASYHSYLSKIWGLVLATTIVLSFAAADTAALHIAWWASFGLGVVCSVEGFVISLIMPEWRHDLKTLPRAFGARRHILLERQRAEKRRLRKAAAVAASILLATVSIPSGASSIPSVNYIGGSTPGITVGTPGALDTGPDQLIFQWSSGSLAIPYAQIQNFSYRQKQTPNLGILPAIVFGLIRPQIFRHIVSISYLDRSGQKQVAVFEVPKQAKDTLPFVLQERTNVCAEQYQIPCRANAARNSHRVAVQEHYIP